MNLNFCEAGGFLVSPNSELPDDPSEYQAEMRRPVVGCNQVSCGACGASVRSKAAIYPLAQDKPRDWSAVYVADDWSTLPGMDPDPAYRLYVCRCRYEAVNSSRPLVRDGAQTSPWSCAGHAPATLPVTIDGLEITRFSDLERVVRENIDRPGSILGLLYERLAGTPLEDKLGEIASKLLSDPDPGARSLALGLYFSAPQARGARRVLDLARGDRAGFKDVPDTVPITGLDLEGRLLWTLAKLSASGVVSPDEVLDMFRTSALGRKTSRAVLPTLWDRDPQWVRDHTDQILASAPTAVGLLLRQRGSTDEQLVELAKRATGLSAEERALVRRDISMNIFGDVQDALMALFAD